MMININPQPNTRNTLNKPTSNHQVLLPRNPILLIDKIAEVPAEGPREDVEESVDGRDVAGFGLTEVVRVEDTEEDVGEVGVDGEFEAEGCCSVDEIDVNERKG